MAWKAIESKEFITTIDIYDIATGLWYQQPTVGGPSQPLARGCAVVAPSRDYSSFNIYYYGGYDGVHIRDSFNDDVWVLSLPSFVWTRVSTGNPDHARAGHKCVMPYPDQMMVIGGYANLPGAGSPACLQGGIIQMFNLTSAKWVDSYDPEVYGEYGVPESVYAVIGGNAAGGATMTAPTPTGWANPALASVWSTPYPTSKLKTFYPYSRVAPPNDTRQALPPPRDDSVPAYVAPVTGVIAGLFVLTLAVLGFFFWRKRRILRLGGTKSESGVTTTTDDTGNRILSWIRGQSGTDTKAPPTVTTEDSPMSPSDLESNRNGPSVHRTPSGVNIHPPIAEMADSALVELPGE